MVSLATCARLGTAESAVGQAQARERYVTSRALAKVIPAVLSGSPRPSISTCLEAVQPAQREAMIIRDQECRAEGCTVPAAWCKARHWGAAGPEGGPPP